MNRRTRFQIYFVVAAQLLLAVPAMSSAFAASAASAAHSAACGGMAPAQHHDGADHCPCCPDGIATTADCLASCTLAAAIPTVMVVVTPVIFSAAPAPEPQKITSHFDDPPPEPPPIR